MLSTPNIWILQSAEEISTEKKSFTRSNKNFEIRRISSNVAFCVFDYDRDSNALPWSWEVVDCCKVLVQRLAKVVGEILNLKKQLWRKKIHLIILNPSSRSSRPKPTFVGRRWDKLLTSTSKVFDDVDCPKMTLLKTWRQGTKGTQVSFWNVHIVFGLTTCNTS